MQTMSLDEAKTRLPALIEAAVADEEVSIAREGLMVQLVPQIIKKPKPQFGSARGLIQMARDFD